MMNRRSFFGLLFGGLLARFTQPPGALQYNYVQEMVAEYIDISVEANRRKFYPVSSPIIQRVVRPMSELLAPYDPDETPLSHLTRR
jgi:hypothetical protein